jgi:DNA-directed RNA polymerase subunit RPC12/RpoP
VDQIIQGIDWLEQKWGPNRACPYCGNQEWTIGVPVEFLTEAVPPRRFARKLTPVYPVTCTNCGNTVLINPAMARGPLPE